MANTATLINQVANGTTHSDFGGVSQYLVAIDTINTDLTIAPAVTGQENFLVGLSLLQAAATTITWKTGTTVLNVWGLAANQGLGDKVQPGWIMSTRKGEALIIQASVAIPQMLVMVATGNGSQL